MQKTITLTLDAGEYAAVTTIAAQLRITPEELAWDGLDCAMQTLDQTGSGNIDEDAAFGTVQGTVRRFDEGHLPDWAHKFKEEPQPAEKPRRKIDLPRKPRREPRERKEKPCRVIRQLFAAFKADHAQHSEHSPERKRCSSKVDLLISDEEMTAITLMATAHRLTTREFIFAAVSGAMEQGLDDPSMSAIYTERGLDRYKFGQLPEWAGYPQSDSEQEGGNQ
jgi:hypothetical protein